MVKRRKVTSKRVAKIASGVLKNRKQDKKSKIVAGSALSQREKSKVRKTHKRKRG